MKKRIPGDHWKPGGGGGADGGAGHGIVGLTVRR